MNWKRIFVKEKTDIDRYTRYIHKRQTFDRAWDRSYIQVHLDETGNCTSAVIITVKTG